MWRISGKIEAMGDGGHGRSSDDDDDDDDDDNEEEEEEAKKMAAWERVSK